ncbi:unnamed protein product [Rhizophagus irregularis]|nr:unnamed protein product [Rhizophagus irregularis]
MITFYSPSESINPDEIRINLDSKEVHARTTYNRWNKQKKKRIISNRLGISYNTQIFANSIDNILKRGRTYIYNKCYSNLNSCPSNKANVKKQQRARFERHRKRVLHNSALSEDAAIEDKLIACKRNGFLCLPSKHFYKPIMHLRYKKKYQTPLQHHYNFKIPSLKARQHVDIRQEVYTAIHSNLMTNYPSFSNQPLKAKDKVQTIMNIVRTPEELLPYVPSEPIYKNGVIFADLNQKEQRTLKPLIEGSKNWIKAVRSIKALADEKIKREAYIDEIKLKWEVHDKEFALRYENLCTSLHHHQNVCHDYFAYLSTRYDASALFMPSSKQGQKKIADIAYKSRFNVNLLGERMEQVHLDSSNEDLYGWECQRNEFPDFYSRLPIRGRKRTVDTYTNLDSFHGLHIVKRSRSDTKD